MSREQAAEIVFEYNNIKDSDLQSEILLGLEQMPTWEEPSAKLLGRMIESHNNVFIYGDYDADGITSVACFRYYYPFMRAIIPERVDGYGLNLALLNNVKRGDLLVTVDCGISNHKEVRELNSRGVTVIVTDHHLPPEVLPDCMIFNPKLGGSYPGLSGSGVVYSLLSTLYGPNDYALQLASVGTICDVVPMLGPNRKIAKNGIELMQANTEKSLLGIAKEMSVPIRDIDFDDVGWKIGPVINAAGRMGYARKALGYFLDGETDASSLVSLNEKRKKEVREEPKILYSKEGDNAIIIVADQKAGMLGLIASRIQRSTGKMAIVASCSEGICRGSARSDGSINCKEFLSGFSRLLEGSGGHRMAAGFSIPQEKIREFGEAVILRSDTIRLDSPEVVPIELDGDKALGLAESIESLAPFGSSFSRPEFNGVVRLANAKSMGRDEAHLSAKGENGRVVMFNGWDQYKSIGSPESAECVFSVGINKFKGNRTPQIIIKEIKE